MEFKGTKGQWEYSNNQVSTGSELVAIVYGFDTKDKKANTRLIVHAPQLLAALSKILNISENVGRAGCTYGDTEMSSIDVVYGYNLALGHCKQGIEDLIKKATNI